MKTETVSPEAGAIPHQVGIYDRPASPAFSWITWMTIPFISALLILAFRYYW